MSQPRRPLQITLWVILAVLTVGMLGLYAVYPRFLEELEARTLNLRFWIRGEKDPGRDVTIVAVDEKSLQEVGRWPWPRSVQAELIDRIHAAGPRAIGLDLFFSESETARSDARLADALRNAVPLAAALPLIVPTESEAGPDAAGSSGNHPDFIDGSAIQRVKGVSVQKHFAVKEATDSLPPVEPIGSAVSQFGHVYTLSDPDGVLRREVLVLRYGEEFFPSLALQVARLSLGIGMDGMALRVGEGVELGDRLIPTDEHGRLLISYYGREMAFPYVSAADVLRGRIGAEELKGKIVFVGTSAMATFDQKITPFSNNYPGVEKNATVVTNILRADFIRQAWVHKVADVITILAVGLGVGWGLILIRGLGETVLAVASLAVLLIWLQAAFVWWGWWLNAVVPVGTLGLAYASVTAHRYLTEERKAKEIRAIFSSYVNPKIVERLVNDPTQARLGGERKELTVLFSDVRGFTGFAERHRPEEVVALLNEYLQAMTDVVFRWDGTLDKFVGDAIMVVWGAPVDQPNHAELAVRCALNMGRRLTELQEKWRAEGKEPLDAGIGINTGEMVVGNMGAAGKKMDYTVIGDHVNLAARVEGLTRQYKTHMLITEYTYQKVKPLIQFEPLHDGPDAPMRQRLGHALIRELASVQVKGKTRPITIFEVTGLKPGQPSEILREAAAAGLKEKAL
jgi:adenylate cyclase